MESLDRLVSFISATDLQSARDFYGGLLGLDVISVDDYALVVRSGSTDLRITKVEAFSPQPFTVLGWTVDSIGHATTALTDRGIEFVNFDGMDQDENGVWHAPDGALVCWFRDPSGNTLSLTQFA